MPLFENLKQIYILNNAKICWKYNFFPNSTINLINYFKWNEKIWRKRQDGNDNDNDDDNDPHLSKKSLTSPSRRSRIINVYVVILRGNRFLHERFIENHSVHFDVVFRLNKFVFCRTKNSFRPRPDIVGGKKRIHGNKEGGRKISIKLTRSGRIPVENRVPGNFYAFAFEQRVHLSPVLNVVLHVQIIYYERIP